MLLWIWMLLWIRLWILLRRIWILLWWIRILLWRIRILLRGMWILLRLLLWIFRKVLQNHHPPASVLAFNVLHSILLSPEKGVLLLLLLLLSGPAGGSGVTFYTLGGLSTMSPVLYGAKWAKSFALNVGPDACKLSFPTMRYKHFLTELDEECEEKQARC
uniref:Uncharacterized protein n=1 Tax=Sphaerodactylus townsendi TaxID=933632 RepID=A0ACB8G740_9SAUR